MKKAILNEINEIKYLFGYKPGRVISEQEISNFILNEEDEDYDHPSLKQLDDYDREKKKEEEERYEKEKEKEIEEEPQHYLESLVEQISEFIKLDVVPDSEKIINYSEVDDTIDIELEFKVKIWKNFYTLPDFATNDLEKLTENVDDVLEYLKDKLDNNRIYNYSEVSQKSGIKRSTETTIEYDEQESEKSDDYIFLIKYHRIVE